MENITVHDTRLGHPILGTQGDLYGNLTNSRCDLGDDYRITDANRSLARNEHDGSMAYGLRQIDPPHFAPLHYQSSFGQVLAVPCSMAWSSAASSGCLR